MFNIGVGKGFNVSPKHKLLPFHLPFPIHPYIPITGGGRVKFSILSFPKILMHGVQGKHSLLSRSTF